MQVEREASHSNRTIIFSSFDPDVCRCASRKLCRTCPGVCLGSCAARRRSSSHPSRFPQAASSAEAACLWRRALRARQARFPVMFLSGGGAYAHVDARRTSVAAALDWALQAGLQGVVLEAGAVQAQPAAAAAARSQGLLVRAGSGDVKGKDAAGRPACGCCAWRLWAGGHQRLCLLRRPWYCGAARFQNHLFCFIVHNMKLC